MGCSNDYFLFNRNTAYFGLEICQPKAGDIVVISGAAGAVGSVAGQIAKILGCTVIGIAGSDEKCKWLKKVLKFDHAINYKTENILKVLYEIAPQGISIYFDNVGGVISSHVIARMRDYGRIVVSGSISSNNLRPRHFPKVVNVQPYFVDKKLKMEGLMVWQYASRWFEGISQLYQWVEEGKIRYVETPTVGFENLPRAFIEMMSGKAIGKAIVKSSL